MATRTYARRAVGVLFAGVLTVACVDLFHSTDFATLCDDQPTAPPCVDSSDGPPPPAMDSGMVTVRPHPDFCSWSHATVYENATKVCARLGGCVGPISATGLSGGTEFGACVIAAELAFDCRTNPALRPSGATDDFWSCVSTATSCDEIRECVYPKGVDVCGNDGGTGTFKACGNDEGNANVQLKCDVSKYGPSLAATPCVMNGQGCARDGTSSSACTGIQGFNCVTTGCKDGTHASDCDVNTSSDRGVDCSLMTATCAPQDGGAGCRPTTADTTLAPTCADDTAVTCDGAVAQACIDHKLVKIDCSGLGNVEGSTPGLPCDVTSAPPLYAVANACIDTTLPAPCVPTTEGCSGGELSACARNREVKIDCATAGFGGCEPGNGTPDNPPHCKLDNPTFAAASD